jgi:hypothetical protein
VTKPLFENSTQRSILGNTYRVKQLEHRPAAGGGTGIDWGVNTDTDFEGLELHSPFMDFLAEFGNYTQEIGANWNVTVGSSTDIETGTFSVHDANSISLRAEDGATDTSIGMTLTDILLDAPFGSITMTGKNGSNVSVDADIRNGAILTGYDMAAMVETHEAGVGDRLSVQVLGSSSGATGAPCISVQKGTTVIFRIDPDGSLHGVTGKSLVFDL